MSSINRIIDGIVCQVIRRTNDVYMAYNDQNKIEPYYGDGLIVPEFSSDHEAAFMLFLRLAEKNSQVGMSFDHTNKWVVRTAKKDGMIYEQTGIDFCEVICNLVIKSEGGQQ